MSAKTTTKRCTVCKTRPVIGGVRNSLEADYCQPCYNYSGDMNRHSDESHDYYYGPDATDEIKAEAAELVKSGEITIQDSCLVCCEADPTTIAYEAPKGHTNGGVKTGTKMTSHNGCDHPATKAGRAACRKARNAAK